MDTHDVRHIKQGIDPNIDPIPSEGYREVRAAEGGKPAGVRFLAFNTVVDIEAFGDDEACRAAFDEAIALCRTYERLFSRTLPHSDIARINDAGGRPVRIDARTYDLLARARYYCAESEGVFDITVGPAVRLWNFHEGHVADPRKLAQAVQHVNWRNLELWQNEGEAAANRADDAAQSHGTASSGQRPRGECPILRKPLGAKRSATPSKRDTPPWGAVPGAVPPDATSSHWARLADPQAAVDAGGIAKGWIADALIDALGTYDLPGIIVNLGGNVAVAGAKPTGEPWRVGIRDPREPSRLIGAVPIARGSAVTSGTYERCFTAPDGTFYHHILDPRTGMPAQTDVAGVTVICEKSIDAEGFSTTLLALGLDRGLSLARRRPEILQAFFIDANGKVTAAKV